MGAYCSFLSVLWGGATFFFTGVIAARIAARSPLLALRVGLAALALLGALRVHRREAAARRRRRGARFADHGASSTALMPFFLLIWSQTDDPNGARRHPQRHDATLHRDGRPYLHHG